MTGRATTTVGVLYPGEMGAAVARLLAERGVAVVTTLGGRSRDTARRAADAGVLALDSLAHVVRVSDVVISLVDPAAAEQVAEGYCQHARLAPRGAVFVDANSVGPDKAVAIAGRVESAGPAFVDASINGLARNLAASGTLYLSGRRAGDVAALFEGATRVRVLGDAPGRASAMKMLLGGLSKGLCALFTELALLAEREGMLDEMLEAAGRTYPGVAAVAERMLPTYPRHAVRRHTEMTELEATARAAGMTPCVVSAVRRFHDTLAGAMAVDPDAAALNGAGPGGLAALLRELASRDRTVNPPSTQTREKVKVKEKTYGH